MSPGRPASGPRERAARRARTACSLAERIDGAEEWLHASHREQGGAAGAPGGAAGGAAGPATAGARPVDVRAFYARLVSSGSLPDFPPDVLSALHQRYG